MDNRHARASLAWLLDHVIAHQDGNVDIDKMHDAICWGFGHDIRNSQLQDELETKLYILQG